jgi:tRNA-dihydrouridine synthase
VKTRLGYDRCIVEDWIATLVTERPAAISLHGRTLTQRYRGRADWDAIGRAVAIARAAGVPLLGNGDIGSAAEATARLVQTGAAGVLLGRTALGDPWIFRAAPAIRAAVAAGTTPEEPRVTPAERLGVMLEHARRYDAARGTRSFHNVRKYLSAYCRGFAGAAVLRRELVETESIAEIEARLETVACV